MPGRQHKRRPSKLQQKLWPRTIISNETRAARYHELLNLGYAPPEARQLRDAGPLTYARALIHAPGRKRFPGLPE